MSKNTRRSASLRICAETVDFDAVARCLQTPPTSVFRKGERAGPRSPPYKRDMCLYESRAGEDAEFDEHVEHLANTLAGAHEEVRRLGGIYEVDMFLGYRSSVDIGDIVFSSKSMAFIASIGVGINISVIFTGE